MNKKSIFLIGLLIFLSILPLLDLFSPGLWLTHDGRDHVARIANFYQNLSEGILTPRWAGNLNWGYGHPILMFLYPLPSYMASLFHFIGFPFVDSVKLVFAASFVASALAMYIWLKEFLNEEAAFVSSLLYVFAPYRFVDLYVRGAIGEHVFFVFPPLVLYFMLKLSKKFSMWYVAGGCLSVAGLLLSHNALSLMFFPLILGYGIFLFLQTKKKRELMLSYILIFILGFGISSFFWLPAYFEGKYTLRDIVTAGEYDDRFVTSFSQFFYGNWNYGGTGQFTVQVGILQWFFIILSIPSLIMLRIKKNKLFLPLLFLFVVFWFSLFIMTPLSDGIWNAVTIIQKFQFPWRFLSLCVFVSAAISGIVVFSFPKKTQLYFVLLVFLGVFVFTHDYWKANGYLLKPDSFYTDIYIGTTDTGESAPIWSVRFMEERPKSFAEVISGVATITNKKRTTTSHTYLINAVTNAQIRENTVYFPGWKVLVNDSAVPMEFQSAKNRGVITYFIPKGKNDVRVVFEDTKVRAISNMVSFISFISLVLLLLYSTIKKSTRK